MLTYGAEFQGLRTKGDWASEGLYRMSQDLTVCVGFYRLSVSPPTELKLETRILNSTREAVHALQPRTRVFC